MPKKKKRKAATTRVKRRAKKKVTKNKAATRRIKTATKKRKPRKRHVVRQIQRTSVVRVVSGKKRTRKKSHRRRRSVVMAGTRRRSVSGKGNSGMLIGLGLGALALYLFTRPKTSAYPTGYPQLPPLQQTSNYVRNDQTNNILQYALAANLAFDAITSLIDRLNNSDDNQVKQIYDTVTTTGDVGVYV